MTCTMARVIQYSLQQDDKAGALQYAPQKLQNEILKKILGALLDSISKLCES